MKPSQLKIAVETCINADEPILIEGPPGIGKSRIVAQVAKDIGRELLDERVADRDPVELAGLFHVENGRTVRTRPEFMPDENDERPFLLFLDEITQAVPLTQSVCLSLVLDRRVGPHRLPKDCRIVAAGNGIEHGAHAQRMSTAFMDRFTRVQAETDLEDFCTWGIGAGIDPSVLGFVRERTELLSKFDKNQRAWPSPRGWESVSKIVQSNSPKSVERDLIAGKVGEGACVEYVAYLERYRDLPPIDDILKDPKGAPVPKDPSLLYALSSGLSYRSEAKTLQTIIDYTERMPTEYRMLTMTFTTQRLGRKTMTEIPAFTKWAVKYQDFYKDWN